MRSRRVAQDVGAALIGFALILGFTYTAGRAMVQSFPQAMGELPTATTMAEVPDEDGPLTLEQILAEVAEDEFPAIAHLQIEGALDGTFRLNLTEYREWQNDGVEEGPTLDLDMKYYSGFDDADPVLTLTASGLEIGVPRTERYTVVIAWNGLTFLAKPGECSIELLSLDFITIPPPFGGANRSDITVPQFTAQATCTEVRALRSDEMISLIMVFDYYPDQYSF